MSLAIMLLKTLPKAKGKMVHEVIMSLGGVDICEINITCDNSENSPYSVKLPLSNKKIFLFTGQGSKS